MRINICVVFTHVDRQFSQDTLTNVVGIRVIGVSLCCVYGKLSPYVFNTV